MPIFNKILLGFGGVILVMILATGYLLYELNEMSRTTRIALTTDVRAIKLLDDLQNLQTEQDRSVQKFYISRDTTYYNLFVVVNDGFGSSIDSLAGIQSGSIETGLIAGIRQTMGWLRETIEVERHRRSIRKENAYLAKISRDSLDVVHNSLRQLVQIHQAEMGETMREVQLSMDRSVRFAMIFSVSSLFVSLLLAIFIARTITRPISVLIGGADKIAHESFVHIDVNSSDEIAKLAEAFNDMSAKLKNINEFKANMLHEISHELKNPLSTILGAHYLLASARAGSISEDQRHLLGIIREGAERLVSFSQQFLELTKVEADMMEYSFTRTDILPLVRSLVEKAQVSAVLKNITVSMKEEPVPEIMADPEKMSVIIENLVSNAIKYTSKTGKVELVVAPCETGLEVAVSDSGIGIPADDLPHIFTKFYRAKNSASAGTKGTGIGLALVKALTEKHGGTVSVTSTPGVGSVFRVRFPAADRTGIRFMQPETADKSAGSV